MEKVLICFNKNYFVNINGNISNVNTGRVLKPFIGSSGYLQVTLFNGIKNCNYSVHRIVCSHFLPNPNNYRTVNHKDGNKKNNSLINLEWCSHSQNMKHAYFTGLRKGKKSKKIIDATTGNRYNSVAELSKILKCSKPAIYMHINTGKPKSIKGKIFVYAE